MVFDAQKREGSHYTPQVLADFVAKQICESAGMLSQPELRILEPSVGDGELLEALVKAISAVCSAKMTVTAFDTDSDALGSARNRISQLKMKSLVVEWKHVDFLDYVVNERDSLNLPLFEMTAIKTNEYDIIIANPPYVRTTVMGQKESQRLSEVFKLEGRVDLYYAFLIAINRMLSANGIAGVIVSNRFLTTLSGASIRKAMLEQYEIIHVWDLGDTKIFNAAVLPSVLLMKKPGLQRGKYIPQFTSVYETKEQNQDVQNVNGSILDYLGQKGAYSIEGVGVFEVKTGVLETGKHNGDVWRISNDETDDWLGCVKSHTVRHFSDIGKIKVGVKTTADNVFIRKDWDTLSDSDRPELLFPLVTHHVANQFKAKSDNDEWQILYTHCVENGKRKPVNLDDYPKTKRYLEGHRPQLEGRKYVKDAGRQWFEIWVPHNPSAFNKQKIVFRDISVKPTFWLDNSGAIINGDCYWFLDESGENSDVLWLALGIANSQFMEEYYDKKFHNKLYAGRRRFMTQYVSEFPLPQLELACSKRIVTLAKTIFENGINHDLECELNDAVYKAFGLSVKEIRR